MVSKVEMIMGFDKFHKVSKKMRLELEDANYHSVNRAIDYLEIGEDY